jgi:hypothetical protein
MSRGLFRLVGVWSGCWVVREDFFLRIVYEQDILANFGYKNSNL